MTVVVPLLIAVLAAYFLFSGLSRILRRRSISTRWKYEAPHWAVRDKVEIAGFRAVLSGIIRLIIAGALGFLISQLVR